MLLPLSALRITMSSYCLNSFIARFSAFDRFGFGGLALFRVSITLDGAVKAFNTKKSALSPHVIDFDQEKDWDNVKVL